MQKWLSRLIRKHLVQDVPPELAFCESGCRKSSCTAAEFAVCALRPGGPAQVVPLAARPRPARSGCLAPARIVALADHQRLKAAR